MIKLLNGDTLESHLTMRHTLMSKNMIPIALKEANLTLFNLKKVKNGN